MSGIKINSALTENRLFQPSAEFTAKARLKADDLKALLQLDKDDHEVFWANHAKEHIGAIAKPDGIRFADGLPKTHSGKIMRRLLRTIAAGEEITSDTSTLETESVVEQLQGKT